MLRGHMMCEKHVCVCVRCFSFGWDTWAGSKEQCACCDPTSSRQGLPSVAVMLCGAVGAPVVTSAVHPQSEQSRAEQSSAFCWILCLVSIQPSAAATAGVRPRAVAGVQH
jgi:hypothetical protein